MLKTPKAARVPILYALSRGQPSSVPVNGAEAAFARLPTSVRWLGPRLAVQRWELPSQALSWLL